MKGIIVIVLIIYGAWSYYTTQKTSNSNFSIKPVITNHSFKCDGRQHCSQMKSYEEAVFFINNCPATKMDGDNDGIPCERQFGRH